MASSKDTRARATTPASPAASSRSEPTSSMSVSNTVGSLSPSVSGTAISPIFCTPVVLRSRRRLCYRRLVIRVGSAGHGRGCFGQTAPSWWPRARAGAWRSRTSRLAGVAVSRRSRLDVEDGEKGEGAVADGRGVGQHLAVIAIAPARTCPSPSDRYSVARRTSVRSGHRAHEGGLRREGELLPPSIARPTQCSKRRSGRSATGTSQGFSGTFSSAPGTFQGLFAE